MSIGDGQIGPPPFNLPKPSGSSFEVTKLNDTHMAIIRMLIRGKKQKEIAEELGISEVMVSYTKNSPIVQQKLDVMRNIIDAEAIDTAKMINDIQPLAILRMAELLSNKGTDDKLTVTIARDLLDRGGHAAPKTPDLHLHAHATLDEINEIKARAKNRARISGDMIEDATVVDDPDTTDD